MNHEYGKVIKILGFVGIGTLVFPLSKAIFWPRHRFNKDVNYENRTVIVTGATGNLGREFSSSFAKKKMRVIMACRDIDKCKSIRRELVLQTKHKGIACRQLDLEDIDSIYKFTKEVSETEPHIDILINNAAVKEVKNRELTKYGIEKNYFVNFIAPFLLTFLLMDKLKESAKVTRDSRIINIIGLPKEDWSVLLSDINFDKRPYKAKEAYKQSKLALAYFTILLDKFNREQKNCVYVFGTNPGYEKQFESLYRPIGAWEGLVTTLRTYSRISPYQAIGPALKCASEPSYTFDQSGKLYGRFLSTQSWGIADRDEAKAKLVWNNAADLLLNLKTVTKEPSDSKTSTEVPSSSKTDTKVPSK